MEKPKYKYQSKDFKFPFQAYIGCVNLLIGEKGKYRVFLTRVFNDLDVLKKYVLFVLNDFAQNSDGITPSYSGHLIKINLDRTYPLDKSHWKNSENFDKIFLRKFRNDVNILKFWQMSEILVTPDGEIDGVEFFSFCLSSFKGTPKKDIDLFMKNSRQVVDIRAKSAAFYTLEKPLKVNWLTGTKTINQYPIVERYIN